MKALKEKRIRLRSLWRRGLVILSLFALVFAGCNDGSSTGGGEVETSLKTIVNAFILEQPSASKEAQYEGMEIKLDGIKVAVRYNDGNYDEITDTGRFLIYSPYYIAGTNYYTVYLKNDAQGRSFSAKCADKVIPVEEIHWHGSLDKRTYFSDDFPDFSGISLELKYDKLDHKTLQLPKEWRLWRFSERWEDEQVGPFVAITFRDVAMPIPVDKIYYVDEEKLKFDPEPDFADVSKMQIYVDDDYVFKGTIAAASISSNYQDKWLDRLGADTKLVVGYTDTDVTHTYSVAELKTMRDSTPYHNGVGYTWGDQNPRLMLIDAPFYDAAGTANSKTDNYVNNKKGCTVTFAYRGVKMESISVPVFGQFVSVAAESKTGEDIEYNLNPYINWPDPTDPRDDLTSLAKKFDVIATYGLYTDKGTTATRKVDFNGGSKSSGSWVSGDEPGTDGSSKTKLVWDDSLNTYVTVSDFVQGKYYEIRSNFLDQYAVAVASGKDKTYKLTINYTPGLLFSGLPKTAKLSVNFINVAGGGAYLDF